MASYRYGHRPTVSVVVLSHRWRTHPAMVEAALRSVRLQTWADLEVRLEFCEAAWPTKLNDAVATTRGEWVVVLCDDDLLDPDYLAHCLHYRADADVIYTDRKVFRTERPEDGYHFHMHGPDMTGPAAYRVGFDPSEWLFGSSLPMTLCVRRTVWDELGGHDPHMPHSDTEFWYRLARRDPKTRFVYVPHPLFYYREHVGQMCRVVDTLPPALRCFHRKHFAAFGVAWGPRIRGTVEAPGEVLPLEERLGYMAAHFTDLTTVGYMATERKPLGDISKIAVQLKQREATQAVNALITLVLRDAGLSPEEGWKLDGDYNAVREVPDPPADLTVPVAEAKAAEDAAIQAARAEAA